jgi:S-adenosylmethionine uptake transporter
MHLTRSISGTISLTLWFFAIAGLPIATAMTINYSSPLFIGAWMAITAWRAGERIDLRMQSTLILGFLGVMLLLKPTIASDQWIFAIVGTASATLTAVAYLSVKALSQAGEPSARIVFYFSAMNATAGLVGSSIAGFHAHEATGLMLLLAVGVTATLAQLAMTRAYASGGTLLTTNLGFTGILFSTAWGVLLFDDVVRLDSTIGMAIVVIAGVSATLITARAERRAKARGGQRATTTSTVETA